MVLKTVKTDKHTREIFSQVFTGMNGKFTRYKIIKLIKETPLNTQQISNQLEYDYKSIKHSLRVLEKHNLVERTGFGYGDIFSPSDFLLDNYDYFLSHIEKLKQKFSRTKKYI